MSQENASRVLRKKKQDMKFQGVLKQTVQNYFYAIHTHINLDT